MDNVRSRPNMTNAQGVTARPVKKIHSDDSHEEQDGGSQEQAQDQSQQQDENRQGDFTVDALRAMSGGDRLIEKTQKDELDMQRRYKQPKVKVLSSNPSVAFKKKPNTD